MRKMNEFESLFRLHFEGLCRMGLKYVYDLPTVKDLVHDVYMNFWIKLDGLSEDTNYKSYLYTAVRNKCLNHLRDSKQHLRVEDVEISKTNGEEHSLITRELQREIDFALNLLPDRCKEIFMLSREEELAYKEIADKLGISVKTVEAHMSKALKILRNHLSEFMTLLLFFLLN